MTIKQLYDALGRYLDGAIEEDAPVLITLCDAGIGARASTGIRSVDAGFDWESGTIRIEPQDRIYKNIPRMNFPVGITHEDFGGVTYFACGKCHNRVSKTDKFCRHCGYNLV